jgi:hypothetical protein
VVRWSLALLVVAGCDTTFGLDELYECPLDDDDCDRMLDPVDPCPADPGTDADADGDGVGDSCDPNPSVPVDSQLEFEGFAITDSRWVARPDSVATWSVHGGELSLENGALERPAPVNLQPTVEVVVDPEFADIGASVGAYVEDKGSLAIPLECRVEHTATGDDLVVLLGDPAKPPGPGGQAEVGRVKNLPGRSGDRLRIYGGQLPAPDFSVRCRARYGTDEGLYFDWKFFTTQADFDTVGLNARNARANYRSLTIFTTVP